MTPRRHQLPFPAARLIAKLEAEVQELREQLALERADSEASQAATAEARRELELSRERYAQLYDSAPTGYVLLDRNGFIREANLTVAQMLGVERPKLCHTLLAHYVVAGDRRKLLRHLSRCRHSAGDEALTTKLGMVCANSRRRDIELNTRTMPLPPTPSGEVRFHTALVDVTARNQAEAGLQASEEQYRLLFEFNPNPMWIFDEGTLRFLAVNRAAVVLYGWSREEFLRMTVKDIRPPDELPELVRQLAGQRGSRATLVGEWRHWNKDHALLDVEVTISCIQFQGREARLVLVNDVTARKREEAARRVAEEKFRSIVETTDEWIWETNGQGRYRYCNPAVERILGYSPAELVGVSALKFMTAASRREVEERLPRLMGAKQGWTGWVLEWRHKDGTVRWLESNAQPILAPNGQGHLLGYRGVDRDITDRKRAEEALSESRAKLRAAFASMTEAIFIVDAEGRLTDFNDTFITYHRFKDQEECSKTITECPDYLEAFFEDGTPAPPKQWAMLRALRGETCSYTEYRLRRKDTGETWWGSYSFGPIKDKEGRIVGAVVTARDITERKQVEQRLAVNVAALTRMHELSSRAVEAKGLQTLLQEAMDTAVSIVSAAKGTLQLFEGGTLRLVAHQGHKRPFLKFFAAAETVASLCGEATRRGERVVVEDVEQSPLFAGTPSLPMLRAAGVRAAQSTPLLTRGGRLLGILTTQWATPHRPDEHDLWRLDLLVRQVADLIEQRQAEEALLREKELYRTLARNLPGLVYRVHLDGHRRMEFFNQSLVAMTGYTEAELTTGEVCSIEPLIVAEDRAVVVAAIHQAIRKHQPFEVEYRLRTKAGELRHFAERGQPVYGADGRCTQLDGLIFDTTTHKEAAARLQESQARLSQLTENIREVFWLGTPDWNEVLYISPGYKELWGRSRESMYRSPRSWMKAIVAQDRPAVRAAVEAGIAGKLPVHFPPYRVKRPDGTVHWVEARAWPVRDEAGRVYRIAGIIDDITERKRAEEALRASEQRLALATSGARIGMFEWDVATGKVLWTEQQARLLGLATTTTTTTTTTMTTTLSLPYRYRDWARRVHREDLARVEAEQRRCMTKHLPYECEYRVVWPDKSVHWLVGRGVWLYDAKGRPERMLGVTMDITGRKQVEALLRELNVGLEQRVMERTAELSDAHDRLRAIMDNALVGILTLDERGLIVTINPAVTAIFGYAPEELVGSRGNRLWASPIQAADEEFPAHYTQPGDPQLMGAGREVLGRRKDGEVIAVELTISEFRHRDRRQFVAMVRDISARKRLEAELLEVSERERQRLGHDLHDGLGQHLHALYYLASLLEKDMKGSAPKRAREVGRLSRQLEHALTLTRGLARGLQPVNAEPEGLMIALRELAERTRALYRVDCRFLCRAPVLIHRHSAANHLYRIAQEAVNNAMKHGKPTQVRIELTGTPQRVLLGVRDNGVGIRRRSTPAKGMGLRVMQYRADAISGSLTTQRLPEGGTAVVCSVARQALLPQNATTDH